MIKEIRIDSIEGLLPLLTEQKYRPDLKRNRTSFVYRGMPDVSFKMTTSLKRNCKHLQSQLEPSMLKNFAKYAVIEDPSIASSVWRQMITGQHHGLPTRLLDWTQSALVGLHFAVTEDSLDEMDTHDCMVWRIDIDEIHSLVPEKYQEVLRKNKAEVFSVDMLTAAAISLEEYDRDMEDRAMVVIEPPSINQRIVNQYSFFSVIPTAMDNVEVFLDKYTEGSVKYIISAKLRWRVRDMLDQLNMSERIFYPGLDGLSKWIGRHYFVKD